MPMYDWECAHGHRFEQVVLIADRNDPISCTGTVNDLILDPANPPDGLEIKEIEHDGVKMTVAAVPCRLKAKRVEVCHARPGMMLDYGLGRNMDLANEGRYPGYPSTRGVRR